MCAQEQEIDYRTTITSDNDHHATVSSRVYLFGWPFEECLIKTLMYQEPLIGKNVEEGALDKLPPTIFRI